MTMKKYAGRLFREAGQSVSGFAHSAGDVAAAYRGPAALAGLGAGTYVLGRRFGRIPGVKKAAGIAAPLLLKRALSETRGIYARRAAEGMATPFERGIAYAGRGFAPQESPASTGDVIRFPEDPRLRYPNFIDNGRVVGAYPMAA